jgi:hypothetical protein
MAMDISNIKTFEINKFEKQNEKTSESSILSILFGIYESDIKQLLDFGFVYNYEDGWFVTKLEINNRIHLVWIQKQIREESKLRRYRLSFQKKDDVVLKGSNELFLYCDINIVNASINLQSFLYHIHNVYKLNQTVNKEEVEKETFKQFVENEKIKS